MASLQERRGWRRSRTNCGASVIGKRNKDFGGSQAMATGWGKVSYSKGADVLQEVSLTIEKDCGGAPSGTICAVGSDANICGGDSGGPLMVERNGRQTLAGITSHARTKWRNG